MDKLKLDDSSKAQSKSGILFSTLSGSKFFGYDILKVICSKPKNVVFKARSVSSKDHVALKFLTRYLLDRAPEFEEQLKLEVEVLKQVRSHRIVQIRKYSFEESFISYQFVSGKPLVAAGKIEPATACRMIELICDPVDELHQLGFVHCDIKPDNLMISRDKIRLFDFGSVCRIGLSDTGLVSKKHSLGTFSYQAPEQNQKTGSYTPAVDVFGLCSTLFCILVGKRFESSDKILPNLEKYLNRLPGFEIEMFIELFRKGLAKDPSHRFNSAPELRDQVRKCRSALGK